MDNYKDIEQGCEINGVVWATRNINTPFYFTEKPEDFGMIFQWNKLKSWDLNNDFAIEWNNDRSKSRKWNKITDPSPKGWRLPTVKEIHSLCNENKVKKEPFIQNNTKGIKFTDLNNDNSIFIPLVGIHRHLSDGSLVKYENGEYWSQEAFGETRAWLLSFDENSKTHVLAYDKSEAYSIRCVKK